MKKCPHCKKKVSETARKCKFCGKWIVEKGDVTEKIESKENLDEKELIDVERIGKILIGWDDGGEDNGKDEDSNTQKILEICLVGLIILGVGVVIIALIIG